VNFNARTWRLPLRVLALVLIVAAVPLPCLAGDTSQPAARPRLQASIKPIVHVVALTRPSAPPAKFQATPDAKAQLGSTSFFRTPAGVAVLAIVAAGAGYALYSASHNRIHSVIRQTQ
jgi:hypothetical protein